MIQNSVNSCKSQCSSYGETPLQIFFDNSGAGPVDLVMYLLLTPEPETGSDVPLATTEPARNVVTVESSMPGLETSDSVEAGVPGLVADTVEAGVPGLVADTAKAGVPGLVASFVADGESKVAKTGEEITDGAPATLFTTAVTVWVLAKPETTALIVGADVGKERLAVTV